jgi:hypothetical protein
VKRLMVLVAVGCAGAACLAGCTKDPGDEGARAPVSGKVTFADGKPLTRGAVIFAPDASKGNESKHEPRGYINDQGIYKVMTDPKKEGALPGPYKIMILADEPLDDKNPYKTPPSLIDRKYNNAATSGFAVEVIKNPEPGRYDFKVTK